MLNHPVDQATTIATANVRFRDTAVDLSHMLHDGQGVMSCRYEPADAYVAVIQLGRLPAHDYWQGGRLHHQEAGGNSAIKIFHLEDGPTCRIAGRNDNLHLFMPRAALDELADEAKAPHIDQLRTGDGWEAHDTVIEGLKRAIVAGFELDGGRQSLFVDHAVLALHSHIAEVYGGMRPGTRRSSGGLAPWQERLAKDVLAARLDGDVSLAEVAAATGLSLSHFTRAFKVSTETTPHAWRQARRIERAKGLMSDPNLPLANIAIQTGFADQSHLTRVFARQTGMTPGVWRRQQMA